MKTLTRCALSAFEDETPAKTLGSDLDIIRAASILTHMADALVVDECRMCGGEIIGASYTVTRTGGGSFTACRSCGIDVYALTGGVGYTAVFA